MALSRTNLLGATSANPQGTGAYTTSAFSPPSNSLLVVAVYAMEVSGTTDPSVDITVSGGGWTYTSRVNVGATPSFSIGVNIFTAPVGAGASMTLSIDCGARNIQVFAVSVVAYEGYDTGSPVGGTGTVVDTASPDGAQSLTLSAAPATDSEVFAALGMDKETVGVTPGSAFNEIDDLQSSTEGGLETEARTGSASTTVDWVDSHTGTGVIFKCVGAALEIRAAAAVGQPAAGYVPVALPPWLLAAILANRGRAPASTPPSVVELIPATADLAGVALTPTPQPVNLTLTPTTATFAAVPVTPVPQPVTVALTPASGTLAGVALTPVPQPVTVALTPATATFSAVALDPVPQPVVVALTPAAAVFSGVTLGVGDTVALSPATASLVAVALTPIPQPVTLALSTAAAVLACVVLAPVAQPVTVALAPAVATLGAGVVTPLSAPAWLSGVDRAGGIVAGVDRSAGILTGVDREVGSVS